MKHYQSMRGKKVLGQANTVCFDTNKGRPYEVNQHNQPAHFANIKEKVTNI